MILSPITAFWFMIWCLLSWPLDIKDVLFGVIVAIFATYLSHEIRQGKNASEPRVVPTPARIFWFFAYLALFAWECFKANIDVALRVINPKLPIQPGTIKVTTELKSDIALTFLANSITLTPGMTTIDIDKCNGLLYVHFLVVKEIDGLVRCDTRTIRKFENILKKVFEP